MSYFDQVFQSLFPKKEQKNKLLNHEVLKRNDKYLMEYKKWQMSPTRYDLLKIISNSYLLKEKGISQVPEVHLLKTTSSNGLAISYNKEINPQDFQFFFDSLAESVARVEYKYAVSDVTIEDKGKYVETREKHYLKPKNNNKVPINQRFGNVIIEFIKINDTPSFIKLVANTYNDRNYSSPERFESLAEYLFELN